MQNAALTGWQWVAIALGVIGATIVVARMMNQDLKKPDKKN
jgi:hypothetical protein